MKRNNLIIDGLDQVKYQHTKSAKPLCIIIASDDDYHGK